jgi:hypothetical protein
VPKATALVGIRDAIVTGKLKFLPLLSPGHIHRTTIPDQHLSRVAVDSTMGSASVRGYRLVYNQPVTAELLHDALEFCEVQRLLNVTIDMQFVAVNHVALFIR